MRRQAIEILDELIEVDVQARIAEWILLRRRHQAELRAPQRTRRKNPLHAGAAHVPLFAPPTGGSVPYFPALGPNPVLPALGDALVEEPSDDSDDAELAIAGNVNEIA